MSELISVLIPAYNHQNYIESCLESFIAQTYPNIEVIVLDDGSPDDTWQMIESLKKRCEARFTRFICARKENEGISKTLNRALSMASGEFVFICASDDSVTPNALTDLYAEMTDPELGVVMGNCLIIDDDGQQCYWDKKRNNVYSTKDAVYLSFTEYLDKTRPDVDFYSGEFGNYPSLLKENYIPNGYLIRKRWMDHIGGYSEKAPFEDYFLMLQLSKYTKMKCIKSDTFFYRWHATNTIKKPILKTDISLGLKMLAQEVDIVCERGLEEFKPIINEFYARKMPKCLFNLPGVIRVDKYKYNEVSVISFRLLGFSFEIKR